MSLPNVYLKEIPWYDVIVEGSWTGGSPGYSISNLQVPCIKIDQSTFGFSFAQDFSYPPTYDNYDDTGLFGTWEMNDTVEWTLTDYCDKFTKFTLLYYALNPYTSEGTLYGSWAVATKATFLPQLKSYVQNIAQLYYPHMKNICLLFSDLYVPYTEFAKYPTDPGKVIPITPIPYEDQNYDDFSAYIWLAYSGNDGVLL